MTIDVKNHNSTLSVYDNYKTYNNWDSTSRRTVSKMRKSHLIFGGGHRKTKSTNALQTISAVQRRQPSFSFTQSKRD